MEKSGQPQYQSVCENCGALFGSEEAFPNLCWCSDCKSKVAEPDIKEQIARLYYSNTFWASTGVAWEGCGNEHPYRKTAFDFSSAALSLIREEIEKCLLTDEEASDAYYCADSGRPSKNVARTQLQKILKALG